MFDDVLNKSLIMFSIFTFACWIEIELLSTASVTQEKYNHPKLSIL